MVILDQTGRTVSVPSFPQRIISLVPSQTELLHDLELTERVVGITRFCVHPTQWRETKAIIGGTKDFNFDVIKALNPDLIIGNKEENYKEGIEELEKHYPVWMSDIYDLNDALKMIQEVGALTSASRQSEMICNQIKRGFSNLKPRNGARVLYLIWRKPWMAAASDTFIDFMIRTSGWKNCLEEVKRYPQLSSEDITRLDPDIILLSSEPFPFREKHIEELHNISARSKIALVDGEMFSWYGSRLRLAPAYLNSLTL